MQMNSQHSRADCHASSQLSLKHNLTAFIVSLRQRDVSLMTTSCNSFGVKRIVRLLALICGYLVKNINFWILNNCRMEKLIHLPKPVHDASSDINIKDLGAIWKLLLERQCPSFLDDVMTLAMLQWSSVESLLKKYLDSSDSEEPDKARCDAVAGAWMSVHDNSTILRSTKTDSVDSKASMSTSLADKFTDEFASLKLREKEEDEGMN